MLFEDLDKKIREAADQHYPAYDEKAWHKMEKLLNVHLPQQRDDKRRIIFLTLLLLLIGGGGAFLLISKPWNKESVSQKIVREDNKVQPSTSDASATSSNAVTLQSGTNADQKKPESKNDLSGQKADVTKAASPRAADNLIQHTAISETAKGGSKQTKAVVRTRDVSDVANNKNNKSLAGVENNSSVKDQISSKQSGDTQSGIATNTKDNKDIAKTTGNELVNTPDEKSVEIAKTENKSPEQSTATTQQKKSTPSKTSMKNRGEFGFFVSVGPDVSKVRDSKMGKTTLAYGGGISYTKNRITLRTGIYASKKIYWAAASDYKLSFTPPPTSKFEGADANCDVIDIPLKVSYAFAKGPKASWFASTGLSSYLMKKENYVYTYKTASSMFYYPYETRNENKHFFSVLDLSAGYTYKINKTVFITAEPYAEIPLTGIGVGKVHLSSGGVLFSLGITPFRK